MPAVIECFRTEHSGHDHFLGYFFLNEQFSFKILEAAGFPQHKPQNTSLSDEDGEMKR
jgi:hypothetical protein